MPHKKHIPVATETYAPFVFGIETENDFIVSVRGTHTLQDLDTLTERWKALAPIKSNKIFEAICNALHIATVQVSTSQDSPACNLIPRYLKDLADNMHHGIFRHASHALLLIIAELRTFKTKKPDGRVMVYGHSLGAACAVIISCILTDVLSFTNVHCYCIACPKVFEADSRLHENNKFQYKHVYTQGDPIVEKTHLGSMSLGIQNRFINYKENDRQLNRKQAMSDVLTDGILLPHSVFRVQSRLYNNTVPVFVEENFTNIRMCNNAAHTSYLNGDPVLGGAANHALTMARTARSRTKTRSTRSRTKTRRARSRTKTRSARSRTNTRRARSRTKTRRAHS
jgi:hypothetical protein